MQFDHYNISLFILILFHQLKLFKCDITTISTFAETATKPPYVDVSSFFCSNAVSMSIGDPPQAFSALFDFSSSDIIVMDSECGNQQPDPKCKRYCVDSMFSSMYCAPLCQKPDEANLDLLCPMYMRTKFDSNYTTPYYSNTSKTYKNITKELHDIIWTNNQVVPQRLVGKYGKEKIQFFWNEKIFFNRRVFLEANDIQFVRGMLVDPRFFARTSVTIGMAPSNHSLIVQLYNQNIIENAQVSFSVNKLSFITQNKMTFGSFDKTMCANWTFHKTISKDSWILNTQSVTFLNETVEGSFLMLIDPSNCEGIVLPKKLLEKLVSNGILYNTSKDQDFYFYHCDIIPTLSFTIDDQEIVLSNFTLFKGCDRFVPDRCISTIKVPKSNNRYTNELKMSLDLNFAANNCYGLDYGNMEVGFGTVYGDWYDDPGALPDKNEPQKICYTVPI